MTRRKEEQDRVFLDREADLWFQRNREALLRTGRFDWPEHILANLEGAAAIPSFLKLGCSNGWRLHRLRERFGGAGNRNEEPRT